MGSSDYPQGKWTPYLIEPHWPHGSSTEAAVASARNRANIQLMYENYGIDLANTRNGPLSEQEGQTADAAQGAFLQGEQHAVEVAEKNGVKKKSYETAASAFESLRQALGGVADRGNTAIDKILASKGGLGKIGEVVQIISDSQKDSARASMQCVDQLKNALQCILTAQGDGRSAEQWARDHGINLDPPPTPDKESMTQQVQSLLATPSHGLEGGFSSVIQRGDTENNPGTANLLHSRTEQPTVVAAGNLEGKGALIPAGSSTAAPPSGADGLGTANTVGGRLPGSGLPMAPSASAPVGGINGIGSASAGLSAGSLSVTGGGPASGAFGSATQAGGTPSLSGLSGSHGVSPDGLANSFSQGVQSGAPMSAGSEALTQGISEAAQSPVAHGPEVAPPTNFSPSTAPSSSLHYGFDAPQAPQEVAPAYTPPADTSSQMYSAPAAPMAPMPQAGGAMAAAPAGPLPAYGSDLRPTTVAPAASAPVGPVAASPLSAPVNPSSAQSTLGQPAVVKQQPAAPGAPISSAGITESAVAATAAGAIAGAASEQSAARNRLQSLVEFVARQEPKLRWAIGYREDGSTILVTDLASGWIPPHIEIPSGVQLLVPARRRGDFETLLGDTTNTATWTPGHYLPPEKDVDPVPTSFRARQVPDIDELNWELAQATNWRDGLPRLAHTLAKAGAAGTGVLDSETDLLQEHLTAFSQKVLRSYPDNLDTADVGNWQLLAAIDALLTNQRTVLNYHYAWFQALSMATHGGAR